MTNELKPCPFCGEQPKLTDCAYDALTIIECESCKKTRDRVVRLEYALHDQAIEAWNTRAERTCTPKYERDSQGYMTLVCDMCHKPIDDTDSFCSNCGDKGGV
jgi:RNA polymerase subunit RPABC4/transcription elongation factor Spt4